MPIRPEERQRYPKDWAVISRRVKERAGWRCQWCRREHQVTVQVFRDGSWVEGDTWVHTSALGERLGIRPPRTWPRSSNEVRTILTTAHLDHTPENCGDDNLVALCQRCHLHYDRHQHARSRKSGLLQAEVRMGQLELSLGDPMSRDIIRGLPVRELDRHYYRMATDAWHEGTLSDLSNSPDPDLCMVDRETDTDWIGNWVFGFGFIDVAFPKTTTRELTPEEVDYYAGTGVSLAGRVRPFTREELENGVEPWKPSGERQTLGPLPVNGEQR